MAGDLLLVSDVEFNIVALSMKPGMDVLLSEELSHMEDVSSVGLLPAVPSEPEL